MNIQLHKSSPVEGKITIHLNEKDYQAAVAKKIKEHSKNAQVKGFRPGYVPMQLIQKMYGTSILIEEINRILSAELDNYIKEQGLTVLGEPRPLRDNEGEIDWATQKEFEFSYEIGIVETIDLSPINANITLTNYKVDLIEEEQVDTLIEQLQHRYKKEEIKEKSSIEDTLYGTLKSKDHVINTSIDLSIKQLPKEEQVRFVGLLSNDVVLLKGNLLKTISNKDLAIPENTYQKILGMPMDDFEFVVNKSYHATLPKMEQTFFDEILGEGKVASEEGFREQLKVMMHKDAEKEVVDLVDIELQNSLLKAVVIPLPDAFLKRWLREKNVETPPGEIEKYYSEYQNELRWDLLLAQILKENKIKVDYQDVIAYTKEQFKKSEVENNDQDEATAVAHEQFLQREVIKFFQEDRTGKHYKRYHEQFSTSKALACIKAKITTEEKSISVKELGEKRKLYA